MLRLLFTSYLIMLMWNAVAGGFNMPRMNFGYAVCIFIFISIIIDMIRGK